MPHATPIARAVRLPTSAVMHAFDHISDHILALVQPGTMMALPLLVPLIQMYTDFGFTSQPVIIGLMLYSMLISPVEHVIGFLMNCLTRM